MTTRLEELLTDYEHGSLTRRELLGALAAMVAMPAVAAAAAPLPPAIGRVRVLNHVTVRVPDVKKSAAFYQSLLGLSVLTPQADGVNLATGGSSFLGLYPADAGAAASIDHFCLGVDGFDADAVSAALAAKGVTASIRQRGDTKELYFTDPDGVRVQLQDPHYIGGVGPRGDRRPG